MRFELSDEEQADAAAPRLTEDEAYERMKSTFDAEDVQED